MMTVNSTRYRFTRSLRKTELERVEIGSISDPAPTFHLFPEWVRTSGNRSERVDQQRYQIALPKRN